MSSGSVDPGRWPKTMLTSHWQTWLDMSWRYNTPQWCHRIHSDYGKSQKLRKMQSDPNTGGSSSSVLLIATHSMMSTYLGSITMVLRLPLTSAASTKGLHRYRGVCAGGEGAKIELGVTASMLFEEVGDFFCTRCELHGTDRLHTDESVRAGRRTPVSPN